MENINDSNIEIKPQEDNQFLLELFFRVLNNWKLILITIILFLLLGVGYIIITSKMYESSSSVLLNEEDKKNASSVMDLEALGLLSTTNNIDNEIGVFSSPDLMLQVVKSLNLNYSYGIKKRLRYVDIYNQSPIIVQLENDSILKEYTFDFSIKKSGGKYSINGVAYNRETKEEIEISEEIGTLPTSIDLIYTKLIISNNQQKKEQHYDNILVKITPPWIATRNYANNLLVSPTTKQSSILSLKINTSNPKKGEDILNELILKYNQDNVKDKNQTAYNTSIFINERLNSIASELDDVEKEVETYKQSQGITNLTSEAQMYMQQTAVNTQKQAETETQLRIVEMVESFIINPSNNEKAIPNLGITDPGLVQSITEYNNKLLQSSALINNTSNENPSRQRVVEELATAKEIILNLVKNVKNSLLITKGEINNQLSSSSSKIYTLPSQERGLLEKMRQQQIKENLYLFLLQKREETNIAMASTNDKAKIIISPKTSEVPKSPNNKIILIGMFLMGILMSALIIYLKYLIKNKIESRSELERISDVPVIGQIFLNEEESSIVIHPDSSSSIAELFRFLRNNIEFVLKSDAHKIILVTSTTAGEGKTFISSNLASVFALNRKKVLLVGMDIRNPQLANTINFKKGYGFVDYISGNLFDWKNLVVQPVQDIPNLDVLQAGTIPPNPNELLKSEKIAIFLEEAKTLYDIIILDTAPTGIISDTYLLSKYTDVTLYVTRESVTHKSTISFINSLYNENRFNNMYILLNGVSSKLTNYKYGYGKTYGYKSK